MRRHRNRLTAVFRFADHVKIVFKFQNLFEFLAHDPVVIRQQDGDSFHEYCYVRNVRALACLICVSWPGVSGTGILFISLSSRTSVGIESAGCWLLRRDYTIFVKGIIHRTNFNHKSAVGAMGSSPYRRGEPFNGERQTSCLRILGVPPRLHLQKTRHKPDKPDIAKRSATHPPLGATGAGWRGCGAI